MKQTGTATFTCILCKQSQEAVNAMYRLVMHCRTCRKQTVFVHRQSLQPLQTQPNHVPAQRV